MQKSNYRLAATALKRKADEVRMMGIDLAILHHIERLDSDVMFWPFLPSGGNVSATSVAEMPIQNTGKKKEQELQRHQSRTNPWKHVKGASCFFWLAMYFICGCKKCLDRGSIRVPPVGGSVPPLYRNEATSDGKDGSSF